MTPQEDRILHIIHFMEYDVLSDSQHDWVVRLEEKFNKYGYLSEREMEILEDIFKQANEKA